MSATIEKIQRQIAENPILLHSYRLTVFSVKAHAIFKMRE